jgi:hypothetical protein
MINMDLEDAANNLRMNFEHRWRSVCFFHRLAEGIEPCQLVQINADPKVNLYWYVQNNFDQKIAHGSKC